MIMVLREAGPDAVHIDEVLRLHAPDVDSLEYAAWEERVIVAADSDCSDLLASRQVAGPSVVSVQRQNRPADRLS